MAVTSMSQSSIANYGKRNTFNQPIIVLGANEEALVGGYQYYLFTESSALTIVQGNITAEILAIMLPKIWQREVMGLPLALVLVAPLALPVPMAVILFSRAHLLLRRWVAVVVHCPILWVLTVALVAVGLP